MDTTLREKAEALLDHADDNIASLSENDIRHIIQELRVHQIELELQNEELRQSQKELEITKSHYLNLFNQAPIGYITMESSGIILKANQTFGGMIGMSPDDLLFKPFSDFISPDDRELFFARYNAFFKNPDRKIMELRLVPEAGLPFHARIEGRLETSAHPVSHHDRKSKKSLLVTINDISGQKEAEAALNTQADFLKTLLAAIPSPVFYKDADGLYARCNRAFETITGKRREDIIGKTDSEIWPPEYQTALSDPDGDLIDPSEIGKHEAELQDAAGRRRNMIVYKSAYRNKSGDSEGVIGIMLDITDRKNAEEALRRELRINTTLADTAALLLEGSNIDDVSHMILESAKTLTESGYGFVGHIDPATGYFFSTTMTRDIWDQCHVPDKTIVFKKFSGLWGWVLQNRKALMTNAPDRDPRSSGTPEGHIPIHRFCSVPVMDKDTLIGLIALANSARDYTSQDLLILERLASLYGLSIQRMWAEAELKQARDKAEGSDRAKSRFLAAMSHEIRTPLNAVIGMTNLVLDTALDSQQTEYLEIVNASAVHLLGLLDDILHLSKIEAGGIEFENINFDIRPTLRKTVRTFELKALEKRLELTFDVDGAVPETLAGDVFRLNQVLINLIGNAIKFTEKGEIRVSAGLEERTAGKAVLLFSVSDTGAGIPPEKRQKIFEPFSQADTSTTREYGGTGLGLTICKRVVESAGGKIWVAGNSVNGSTFFFTFPFEIGKKQERAKTSENVGDAEQKRPITAGPGVDPSRKAKILLVEDNEFNQKLAVVLLKNRGHHVIVAQNGREAVAAYKAEKPDVVLMDVEMPVMDGLEATRRIRAAESENNSHVPIIAMTAHAFDTDRDQALGSGMDGFLSKPIDAEALYGIVDKFLRRG